MISIVIPIYNQAKLLPRCLESIFNQTYQDFEVIIVNDGSTDGISKSLERFKDKVKLFNQENKGAPAARNRGAENATGDYLIFCDADLQLKPNFLQILLEALENHLDKSYAYCAFKYGFKKFKLRPFDGEALRQNNYIHTTSLMRRGDFVGFDESLKRFQDWDLWLTMLEQGKKGIFAPQVLIEQKPGGTMSKWMPKFIYKLPFKLKAVVEYERAKNIVKKKHKLI